MNELRIIQRFFHLSEIQLLQTKSYTWKQTNKGYKTKLVDVLCFLNMSYYVKSVHVRTPHLSVFSPNAGKYVPGKLRTRTLFTQ